MRPAGRSPSPAHGDVTAVDAQPTRAGPAPTAPPAELVAGRYRLLEVLGRGGMGIVWKAWDEQLRRVVALKRILPGAGVDAEQVARLLREAQLVAKLQHPGIVPVYDVCPTGPEPFFTAEFVDGRPFDRVLAAADRPPGWAPVLAWIRAIAEALAFAHERGVIHRDIKPSNILVDAAGRPRVLDFGLAKEIRPAAAQGDPTGDLTRSGDVLGTPRWMSPEQALGATGVVGPAADQFSLGAVYYQALTGRPPFDGRTVWELQHAILTADPVPPRRLVPRLPRDVETICLKALEKDPRRRYRTLGEMAEDLRRAEAGEPIHARPIPFAERWARQALRHWRAVLPTAAAAALALFLGGSWLAASLDRAQRLRDSLALAEGLEREGAHRPARDAYRTALDLDPAHPLARDGFARTERAAEAAEREAERARSALEKSRRVSAIFARWSRLGRTLEEIEATATDDRLDPTERERRLAPRLAEVRAFESGAAGDPADEATAGALAGWAYWLAGHEGPGLAALRAAAERDPDLPYGALFEALALLSRYQQAHLVRIHEVRPEGLSDALVSADDAELAATGARIEELLARAGGATVWGKEGVVDFQHALRGLAALRAGDAAAAAAELEQALGAPDLRAFESGLLAARVKVRMRARDWAGALEDLRVLSSRRPGWTAAHLLAGLLGLGPATEQAERGEDPLPALDEAIGSFDRALAIDPGLVAARNGRALARLERTDARAARGLDAADDLQAALADFDAILEADAGLSFVRGNRGNARRRWAAGRSSSGEDPGAAFAPAFADHDRAVAEQPESDVALGNRGATGLALAEALLTRGADARAACVRAAADLEQALRRNPARAVLHHHAGLVWTLRGDLDQRAGKDPRAAYEAAVRSQDAALERRPGDPAALVARGAARAARAEAAAAKEDSRTLFEQALADFDAALAARAGFVPALVARGRALRAFGDAERVRRRNPLAHYTRAKEDFDRILAADPAAVAAQVERALVLAALGDTTAQAGRDAAPLYRAAIADLDAALARAPALLDAWLNRAQICELMGDFAGAADAYGRAIALLPQPPAGLVRAREQARKKAEAGGGK